MQFEGLGHAGHMMKIEIQTWFGSLNGEADTVFAQIVILIMISMVIFALKHTFEGALKRFKKDDK
ncbi:MAG: hypothetical protein HRT82_10135 [Henriciella sp.]|nr:hypothetical protein [Henriciella sp.]